jgi:cation-transporting ATPase E
LTRYPLRPRHLTVVDALTIGIPGFVLSFQPSHDPVRPGFVRRVLRFSIPCGVIMGVATMFVYEFVQGRLGQTIEEAQSGAALTLIALGLWVLFELARPLDRIRVALLVVLMAMGIGAFTIDPVADFFLLEVPPADVAGWIAGVVAAACLLISLALHLVGGREPLRPVLTDGRADTPDRSPR